MMKLLFAAMLAAFPAFCACPTSDCVTQTLTRLSVPSSAAGNANGDIYVLQVNWIAATDGTLTATRLLRSSDVLQDTNGMYIYQMTTDPGSPAPTDNYDISLVATTGLDMLGGAGNDRDTTTTEMAVPTSLNPIFNGNVNFTLTGNSVNVAQGTVYIYLLQNGALRAGLPSNIVFPLTVPNGGTGVTSITANQFVYGAGASPIQSSPFLINDTTPGLYTPVGPVLYNGTNGCRIYMSAPSGTFPRAERFVFDCSGVSSAPSPDMYFYTGSATYSVGAGGLQGFGQLLLTFNGVGTDVSGNSQSVGSYNNTPAAAGAQQFSPPHVQCGNGWKTNATAASQAVCFSGQVEPVQGAAAPSGIYKFRSGINGFVGTTTNFMINSLGSIVVPPSASDPGCAAGTLGSIWFDSSTAANTAMKVCLNVSSTPTWVTK